ncbi:MAG: peptidoglycan DD-metalloendopeptidase family protein [Alphaproteobacteria bacterium]
MTVNNLFIILMWSGKRIFRTAEKYRVKFFSDLRLSNTQISEQLTALILAGVAAVIIGGVGHMGAHRRAQTETEAQLVLIDPADETSSAQPTLAGEALTAAPERKTDATVAETAAASTTALAPQVLAPVRQLTATVVPTERLVRAAELGRGDTLASLLADADLEENQAQAVLRAIGQVYSLKKLPRGLEISLNFTRVGNDESFDGLTFAPNVDTEIHVTRLTDGSFKAEKILTPPTRQRFAVTGTINTTLYDAGAAHGVPRNVMAAMIRAFSHEIDFQRDLHPGDKFRVFYDQPRTRNGQPAGEATIIYAALETSAVSKAVYRVLYSDGTAEYFNDRGESIRRGLMRTPIDGARTSSTYGMRRHPILGYSMMHKGVDFAAPTGTPVYAAGDGVVQEIGYKSGFGRFVLVKHNGNLSTAYAHMSRFARGVALGSQVQQGDVIAYVGMSGRATGPHLHFEVRLDGRQVNPLSVNMRQGRVLSGATLAQFNRGKSRIQSEFGRLVTASAAAKVEPVAVAANARTKSAARDN